MRKLLLLFFICLGIAAYAGKPYVGIEGGFAPDRTYGSFDETLGFAGVNTGYELNVGKFAFIPQIGLGYENFKEKSIWPGGSELKTIHKSNFYASLSLNADVKIYRGLSLYTSPMVRYTTNDYAYYHWAMYWTFGAAYRFSRFKVFCAYNQQVTEMYHKRLNPISAGVQVFF